ncbi:MAG: hypothetical protein JXJ22_17040 [Bacteroidales bacterium]|nr:hypothetical protein [Bacteroidales bacterium]
MIQRDFTFKAYKTLLQQLIQSGYSFYTLEEYTNSKSKAEKCIVMRHDVDRTPGNALIMAKIEQDLNIKTSYYFRMVPESYNEIIISKIVAMGHELGYHYEDLSLCQGDFSKAILSFEKNLNKLRSFYNIKTICMHGSPKSKYNNLLIWNTYDYKSSGIINEPYYDIDFDKVLYISDASRAWNNNKFNRRDRVTTRFNIPVKSIQNIIELSIENNLPQQVMINIHPHNWASGIMEWTKIILFQSLKNQIKRVLVFSDKMQNKPEI